MYAVELGLNILVIFALSGCIVWAGILGIKKWKTSPSDMEKGK